MFIVAGLVWETSPSLTRLTTETNFVSGFLGIYIGISFLICLFSYIRNYIIKREHVIPFKFISYLLGFTGISLGVTAAIIANSPVHSLVLIVGYLWYAYLFIQAAHEIEHERRGEPDVTQT